MNNKKIGLVLSGGGARGLAHAGVLKALDELEIPISSLSGTSSGAMVAVLYAAGISPEEMISIVKKSKLFKIGELSFDMKGLLKTRAFKKIVQDNIKVKTFEELNLPVTVCSTDFTNAQTTFFNSGTLLEPLVASCAIPLIFSPVILNGNVMVDGGLLNNLPVEPLIGKCRHIIGVHANPLGTFKGTRFKGMLERCFQMAIMNNTKTKSVACDLFLEPKELSKYSVFDTDHAREIFNIGYQAAMSKKSILIKMIAD
jgi:NTE family protein